MKRTSIMLPPELKFLALQEAKRRGMSLGEFIRVSLEKNLSPGKKKKSSLFGDDWIYEGPCENDISLRHDDYLYGDPEK